MHRTNKPATVTAQPSPTTDPLARAGANGLTRTAG